MPSGLRHQDARQERRWDVAGRIRARAGRGQEKRSCDELSPKRAEHVSPRTRTCSAQVERKCVIIKEVSSFYAVYTKGNGAKDLAGSLVNETEMVVIDDFPVASLEVPKQRAFRDAWPYATTCTLNKAWSDSFPRSRDRAALAAGSSGLMNT